VFLKTWLAARWFVIGLRGKDLWRERRMKMRGLTFEAFPLVPVSGPSPRKAKSDPECDCPDFQWLWVWGQDGDFPSKRGERLQFAAPKTRSTSCNFLNHVTILLFFLTFSNIIVRLLQRLYEQEIATCRAV
jgi:hypothetical protein